MNSMGTRSISWIIGTCLLAGALCLGAYTLVSAPAHPGGEHGEAGHHSDGEHGDRQHDDDD